jgi:hypothetical protein
MLLFQAKEDRMIKRLVLPAGICLLLAGCESPSADGGDLRPSFMQAALTGAIEVRHDGDAQWRHGGPDPTVRFFAVSSRDGGDNRLRLAILASSHVGFEPGVYPVEDIRYVEREDNEGNTATYKRPDGKWFVAESGSFTIVRSEYQPGVWEGLVEGHFEFTAVFWCDHSQDRDSCWAFPDEFPPDAPRIHVTGEFVAEPPPMVPTLPGGS